MKNRYDAIIDKIFLSDLYLGDFCAEYLDAQQVVQHNIVFIRNNPDADLKPVMIGSADNKDYKKLYAFLDVYHKVINYYKYYAKYNMQDKELEAALKNWQRMSQPKQNIFARIANKVR